MEAFDALADAFECAEGGVPLEAAAAALTPVAATAAVAAATAVAVVVAGAADTTACTLNLPPPPPPAAAEGIEGAIVGEGTDGEGWMDGGREEVVVEVDEEGGGP